MAATSPIPCWDNDDFGGKDCSAGPVVRLVPIDRVRTRFKGLRGGCKPMPERSVALSELPLRVVEADDGRFEVIDGFKRLDRWRALELKQVPVVVEMLRSSMEEKVALLEANRPPRTLTPMDEALVVKALRHDDGLGPAAIAGACGHKVAWVQTRLMLADQLCDAVVKRVVAGEVGVTVAHALCALRPEDQAAVCEAIEQHRLKVREALALVSAYRACDRKDERRQLLSNPLGVVRPDKAVAPTVGALCARNEEKLGRVREALNTIRDFRLPDQGLIPAERRRLEAEHRAVIHQLFTTAQALAVEHLGLNNEEETNETRIRTPKKHDPQETAGSEINQETTTKGGDCGAARGCHPPGRDKDQHPSDFEEDRPGAQGRAKNTDQRRPDRDASDVAVGGGCYRESSVDGPAKESRQARPVQGTDTGEGETGPDHHPHPEGDQGQRLLRRSDHPLRLYPGIGHKADTEKESLAPLRDGSG